MIERIAQMHAWLRSAPLGGTHESVNLLMVDLDPNAAFAGQTTAVRAGLEVARTASSPLRIFILKARDAHFDQHGLEKWLERNFESDATPIFVHYGQDLSDVSLAPSDLWVCTHWLTASAMSQLVESTDISARRVIYLIQDFEPAFSPWSTAYALAEATYSKGFIPLVNSKPLARYLQEHGHVDLATANCFYPQLNTTELKRAAIAWSPNSDRQIRVLFYGRPSHARNLYELGIASLKHWISELPEADLSRLTVSSAGVDHDPVDLGRGIFLRSLGKLPLKDYFDLLSNVDIGLALMHSPHPGHLALEMPTAGIPTVTNTFEDYRQPWHPLLQVTGVTQEQIAQGLSRAWGTANTLTSHDFALPAESQLGRSLSDAIGDVAALASRPANTDRAPMLDRRHGETKIASEYKMAAARRAERITELLIENSRLREKLKASSESTARDRAHLKKSSGRLNSLEVDIKRVRADSRFLRSTIKKQSAELDNLRLAVRQRDSQLRRLEKVKSSRPIRLLLPVLRKGLKVRRSIRRWLSNK